MYQSKRRKFYILDQIIEDIDYRYINGLLRCVGKEFLLIYIRSSRSDVRYRKIYENKTVIFGVKLSL